MGKGFMRMFRTPDGRRVGGVFALVTTLFFLWGFCNGMIDGLNKHFQSSLHISKTESAWVQFANFSGYCFMAIPAGLLARWIGYKGGILCGLALIGAGALWFIPATGIGTFVAFLVGLFVLANGLAILETIANPYATVLGSPELGAARINLAQTCNALGTAIGPIVLGQFVLSSTSESNTSNGTLYIPYLIIAGLVVVLMIAFWFTQVPDLAAEDDSITAIGETRRHSRPLFARWHFTLAIITQFFYVAAQIGIWSYFINYITSPGMPLIPGSVAHSLPQGWVFEDKSGLGFNITDKGAAVALSGAMLVYLAGRFIGSMILSVASAHVTLAIFALFNSIMMALVIAPMGWISVAALFGSYFGMSIMFPTIFALGIRGLGDHTKLGSSLLVMSIVGGAIMPFVMGWLADTFSMRIGFVMPLVCFVVVMFYAMFWPALERLDTGREVVD